VNPGKNETFVKADAGPFDEAFDRALKRIESDDPDDRRATAAGGAWVTPPAVFRAPVNPRAQFEPATDGMFLRSQRIRIAWPMTQPTDMRRIRLLRRTGDAVSFTPPLVVTDIDGRPTLTTEFPIGSLGQGTYVIELVIGDGATPDRSLVPFKVTG